jgi:biopolymer transport protein ExbB
MIEEVKNALVHAGATWVLWLLAGLSVLSVAVMLDRLRVFWAQKDDVAGLAGDLHRLLANQNIEGARSRLTQSPSVAASVVLAGIAHCGNGSAAALQAMSAASGLQRARLERRLLFLGTVGNNAPFIGLLGTVIGVVGAFEELGKSSGGAVANQLAPERVMSTISEALVATAVGLLVAIPAVAVFNYFQGLLTSALNDAETLGHVLLTHLGSANRICSEDRIVMRSMNGANSTCSSLLQASAATALVTDHGE